MRLARSTDDAPRACTGRCSRAFGTALPDLGPMVSPLRLAGCLARGRGG